MVRSLGKQHFPALGNHDKESAIYRPSRSESLLAQCRFCRIFSLRLVEPPSCSIGNQCGFATAAKHATLYCHVASVAPDLQFQENLHKHAQLHALVRATFRTLEFQFDDCNCNVRYGQTLAILITSLHSANTAPQHGKFEPAVRPQDMPIPSIVHYVCIKEKASAVLHFPFASFLAIFFAVMYVKPTHIYIHTNFNDSEIREAGAQGEQWTRAVINVFADIVVWDQAIVPTFAGQNEDQHISAVQHKSDFVRWTAIVPIGGIYLDWDVVPLRPLTPLLRAGFAFVGGRQYGGAAEDGSVNGTINNGAFVTKPNSTMARIVVREQHVRSTDSAWASNLRTTTNIAERLVAVPNEVLILDRNAFAPTHWFKDSTDRLFMPNDGQPSPEPIYLNSTDPVEQYENAVLNRQRRKEWEMDFSSTYLLHAFSTSHYLDYINPETILSRTSNFGIATYDAVSRMGALGYLSISDSDEKLARPSPEHDPESKSTDRQIV